MSRFPPIKPADLSSEQKDAYDYFSETAQTFFGPDGEKFHYKNKDGAFIGPFEAYMYTPTLIKPFFDFMGAVAKIPGLPPIARETAILATGSHCSWRKLLEVSGLRSELNPKLSPLTIFTLPINNGYPDKASYETYAHERVALKTTSLTKDQIIMIKNGERPEGLEKSASVAFDVTIELCKKPGPLRKELWDQAVETFGREGTASLLQYVGLYAYTCILLNGANVPVPEGEKLF